MLIEDDEEEHRVAKSDRHAGEDWEVSGLILGGLGGEWAHTGRTGRRVGSYWEDWEVSGLILGG